MATCTNEGTPRIAGQTWIIRMDWPAGVLTTDWSFRSTLKTNIDDDDEDAVLRWDHDVTAAEVASGVVRVEFTNEETADLEGDYYHDIKLKDADGNRGWVRSPTLVQFIKPVTQRTEAI